MYELAETKNIPLEDTSNMQYHQQIGHIPVSIAGPSTHQLDDLMSLPGTNDLQASETQQQIIRSVTPDNNDKTGKQATLLNQQKIQQQTLVKTLFYMLKIKIAHLMVMENIPHPIR
ncbi:hypothetical protein WA026_002379 [Henosepilachna vigintioctopunctata]|uniref:Uncharacterized protein n=1 Tax=Henosepilachna vigintioctopunctata TaxID=420089 RepID=A0AAW1U1K2_9CUCU